MDSKFIEGKVDSKIQKKETKVPDEPHGELLISTTEKAKRIANGFSM